MIRSLGIGVAEDELRTCVLPVVAIGIGYWRSNRFCSHCAWFLLVARGPVAHVVVVAGGDHKMSENAGQGCAQGHQCGSLAGPAPRWVAKVVGIQRISGSKGILCQHHVLSTLPRRLFQRHAITLIRIGACYRYLAEEKSTRLSVSLVEPENLRTTTTSRIGLRMLSFRKVI